MLPELIYEVLRYCTRDDLESLQLTCRSLLRMVVADSKVLPLRTIDEVFMAS